MIGKREGKEKKSLIFIERGKKKEKRLSFRKKRGREDGGGGKKKKEEESPTRKRKKSNLEKGGKGNTSRRGARNSFWERTVQEGKRKTPFKLEGRREGDCLLDKIQRKGSSEEQKRKGGEGVALFFGRKEKKKKKKTLPTMLGKGKETGEGGEKPSLTHIEKKKRKRGGEI